MRKLKLLRISPELLEEFLRKPVPPGIVSAGFPEDARITWAGWSAPDAVIELLVHSESFPATKRGDPLQRMEVTFTRVVPE